MTSLMSFMPGHKDHKTQYKDMTEFRKAFQNNNQNKNEYTYKSVSKILTDLSIKVSQLENTINNRSSVSGTYNETCTPIIIEDKDYKIKMDKASKVLWNTSLRTEYEKFVKTVNNNLKINIDRKKSIYKNQLDESDNTLVVGLYFEFSQYYDSKSKSTVKDQLKKFLNFYWNYCDDNNLSWPTGGKIKKFVNWANDYYNNDRNPPNVKKYPLKRRLRKNPNSSGNDSRLGNETGQGNNLSSENESENESDSEKSAVRQPTVTSTVKQPTVTSTVKQHTVTSTVKQPTVTSTGLVDSVRHVYNTAYSNVVDYLSDTNKFESALDESEESGDDAGTNNELEDTLNATNVQATGNAETNNELENTLNATNVEATGNAETNNELEDGPPEQNLDDALNKWMDGASDTRNEIIDEEKPDTIYKAATPEEFENGRRKFKGPDDKDFWYNKKGVMYTSIKGSERAYDMNKKDVAETRTTRSQQP